MSGGPLSSSPLSDSPISYTHRHNSNPGDVDSDHATHTNLRRSPTLSRSFDPQDARERQRTMDVDMARHLSRARRETISISPELSPIQHHPMHHRPSRPEGPLEGFDPEEYPREVMEDEDRLNTQTAMLTDDEDGAMHPPEPPRIDLTALHHIAQAHDPSLLVSSLARGPVAPSIGRAASLEQHIPPQNDSTFGLPTYQATNISHSQFDFSHMEDFAATEKVSLGVSPTTKFSIDALRRPTTASAPALSSEGAGPSTATTVVNQQTQEPSTSDQEQAIPEASTSGSIKNIEQPTDETPPRPSTSSIRHRKLSQSHPHPRLHRKGIGGKIALFETPHISPSGLGGSPNGGPSSLSARLGLGGLGGGRQQQDGDPLLSGLAAGHAGGTPGTGLPGGILTTGHDRPYRFSFYSNSLAATIHARSLSELPAEGQSFEDLFAGIHPPPSAAVTPPAQPNGNGKSVLTPGTFYSRDASPGDANGYFGAQVAPTPEQQQKRPVGDQKLMMGPGNAEPGEEKTWWLDVLSPTDEEMKMLSKVFSIHPLTTEDILMEETREKIELFRNYYLVCFRSFEQDPYSPTYLEPLNMYIIVFREGILSFHFRPTPHPQNVRRRIKQLKDYISVTSDWISYALIDDITDAFGPLIQSIEYEVDSIDELVLILKEAEQSDMLRRIGTCRKKVMGLLRLMGNKADVVKGLAKRCNENWRVAPTSDIGLYLSDIQDHLITMTQNLNHYEKILSRSHSNYLAQISIEMTDANNQINDVLSKLTALGTVLIPMNLVTGLWGMNVHVPGEGIEGYAWFASIIACLAAFAVIGGYSTYRFMVKN